MSGPKGYSYSPPPPVYMSKGELESSLRGVFALQASITRLSEEIKCLSVNDSKRNINFTCSSYNNECATALMPFQPYHSSLVEISIFRSIQPKINEKIAQLKAFENKLLAAKNDFKKKQNDYKSYLGLETFHLNTQYTVDNLKQDGGAYIQKYLEEDDPNLSTLLDEINTLPPLDSIPPFKFGFSQKLDKYKKDINQQISTLLDQIKTIRFSCGGEGEPEHDRLLTEISKEHVARIQENLPSIGNIEDKSQIEQRLKALLESPVSIDNYFFEELDEDISKIINSQKQKETVKDLLRQLNESPQHVSTAETRKNISEEIGALLSSSRIKKRQIVSLEANIASYIQQTTMAADAEEAAAREKQYVRAQIIQGLNSLGYEVADEESELFDFTKGKEYIMRVPDQDNFIRIGFKEDGSFIYNFMIPEDRNNLNIESTQLRLKEMESCCQLFKKVIDNLAAQGVDLSLAKEQPTEERFLLQVPERYQEKPAKTAKRKVAVEQLQQRQRGVE